MLKQIVRTGFIAILLMLTMTPLQAAENPLINMITNQLGVTPAQATSGIGALLSSAQPNMSGDDFAHLGEVIPDMDSLLAAAPLLEASTGESGGLMSMASDMFGDSAGGNAIALQQAFESLGLDAGMVGQYSKLLLDFVNSQGGSALMESLKAALL